MQRTALLLCKGKTSHPYAIPKSQYIGTKEVPQKKEREFAKLWKESSRLAFIRAKGLYEFFFPAGYKGGPGK